MEREGGGTESVLPGRKRCSGEGWARRKEKRSVIGGDGRGVSSLIGQGGADWLGQEWLQAGLWVA